MAEDTLTRDNVRARALRAHTALLASIEGLSPTDIHSLAITPEWTAADMLRHTWIWDELAARCLEDWQGPRDWAPSIGNADDLHAYNMRAVAAKSATDTATVLAGLADVYQRFAVALDTCSDAELAYQAEAPWGDQLSLLALINGSVGHDQEHAHQIAGARSKRR